MSKAIAFILLILSFPVWPLLYFAVKLDSRGSFIFKHKRSGKNRKTFVIYKIRTMVENAEKLKTKYTNLNEADGPVFKIRNDPRYTCVGKLLARVALDELPQLWNVLRGEMALVGPRPLPIDEANKIPKKYEARFSVLPGMTSTWVVKGGHKLKFDEWMNLDLEYVKQKSAQHDLIIFFKTILLILKITVSKI